MFVLLSQLHRLRRRIGLRAPARRGSLCVRHVDTGSCNGCEHELGAISGPHYDVGRYGISIVASPRHADVLLVTGCMTTRMTAPLRTAYDAMPRPRLVAALGDCARGEGALGLSTDMLGSVDQVLPVDLRIPGCPPAPDVIVSALRVALAQRDNGGRNAQHPEARQQLERARDHEPHVRPKASSVPAPLPEGGDIGCGVREGCSDSDATLVAPPAPAPTLRP